MLMTLTRVVSINCLDKKWVKVKMRCKETSSVSSDKLSKPFVISEQKKGSWEGKTDEEYGGNMLLF